MADKKLFLVETVSIFRMRYVVEALEEEHATDEVVMGLGKDNFQEFSQHHVDECISSVREVTHQQYLAQFDKDNDYLKSWDDVEKLKFINKIDYPETK